MTTLQKIEARLAQVAASTEIYKTISKAAIKGCRDGLKAAGIKTQLVGSTVRCLLKDNYVDLDFGKLDVSSGYGTSVKFTKVQVGSVAIAGRMPKVTRNGPSIIPSRWYLVDVSGNTKSKKSEIFAGPFRSEGMATKYKNGNGHGDDGNGGISAEVMNGAWCISNDIKWSVKD